MKHTQIPWQAHETDTGWYVGHGECNGEDYVADVHRWATGNEEKAKANVQLIATAPELLGALEHLFRSVKAHTQIHSALLTARAVIVKAKYTGEVKDEKA